ncbi:MEDS domain-containing protein [Halonatronum saccharophilum]|uniref:MEDS domain-containing protein n=1 Tax=Halonatronum saccharophilum TaxID=150060 RepID=UPI0004881968|nr:MEDS domain-containing protein [Halonatronum saccharophilum]
MILSKDIDSSISLYYGKEHFLVKTVNYLLEGLEEGEKCFYSVANSFEKRVIKFIDNDYIESKQIEFFSMKDLIDIYKLKGTIGLKGRISSLAETLSQDGYCKCRLIAEVGHLIKDIDNEKYLNFEIELLKTLTKSNISLVCAYDVSPIFEEDYEGQPSNFKNILNKTLSNHSYILEGEKVIN